MICVDEARQIIIAAAQNISWRSETLPLHQILGRVAADDILANITQPPFNASAMDGYAVNFDDMALGAKLTIIGEAAAGNPIDIKVRRGQAVRIFTGSSVPDGANHIIIQEDVERQGDNIIVKNVQPTARNIRKSGIDFNEGDMILPKGTRILAPHLSILAAANIAEIKCLCRPRLAFFTNGDELKEPGATLKQGEIINSNPYSIAAFIEHWGGEAINLGCAPDNPQAISDLFAHACGNDVHADIIIPIGGASVGDYDYVKSAFAENGGRIIFSKIAVKPGKPTWFGAMHGRHVLGLPGNPASALVMAALFIQPLIKAYYGEKFTDLSMQLPLATSIEANGPRENYMRAKIIYGPNNQRYIQPADNQDSSLLSPFATHHHLIRRIANAPALNKGDLAEIYPLFGEAL
ncbi:hypothetical protein LPB140_00515 [Sphingorhabdus lutea]|uniref:Molybdopterin molybdenumtransferase n=1 Tax=Sphingorhabdus lutea TaxID=1913578 RepID=A0A1L3J8X4_9SPHN|nr:molybdopterin molybdotransferase MoeA [Sphingorhabdus lutea]APG61575.1 hypothetical protein LPB140_00515 [Sphingorhabdus lutea]